MNQYGKLRGWLNYLVDPEFRDLIRTLLSKKEQTRLPQPVQLVNPGDFLGFMQERERLDEVESYLFTNYGDRFERTLTYLPFIIFAMTSDEAQNLISEAIFDNDEASDAEHKSFQKFRKALEEHNIDITNLLRHYNKERDDWVPHTYSGNSSIQEIINEIIEHINYEIHSKRDSILIRPKFMSANFCAKDRKTWKRLKKSNCILIVDSISLFHPLLRKILVQSSLYSRPKAVVLVLSPIDTKRNQVNQLIEKVLESKTFQIFERFDDELDRWCEFGMGDLRTFQRRLLAVLFEKAEIFKSGFTPNPDTSARMWPKKNAYRTNIQRAWLGS